MNNIIGKKWLKQNAIVQEVKLYIVVDMSIYIQCKQQQQDSDNMTDIFTLKGLSMNFDCV